ncbi:NYN domain-containing protein [Acetomicrobium sp.]|uniref:LabA-like NYN domain-containing protein n=1 Tax=Acetomicrobium sp. TaxID=1872099 RepID=UPI001BD1308F
MKNYAFIDGNNLHLGAKDSGWKVDYKRFRVFLKDKYRVAKAYYFIGYMQEHEGLYDYLSNSGYDLVFKPTIPDYDGNTKGNCDSELVLQAMIDLANYDRAVLVTSDGDFACLAKHLDGLNKLEAVLSPSNRCSYLLRKEVPGKIAFMSNLRAKLEYK